MSKILIVEDEVDISKMIKKRLLSAGFEVVVASDAYEATSLVRKEKPDLIILDLLLPAGGGLTVLKNIRLSAKTRGIPVVVLTGIKDEAYKKRVMALEVTAYIEKPYDPANLIETVNTILLR